MSDKEQQHVAWLAGRLPKSVGLLFEALEPSPAWILTAHFDIMAANKASQILCPNRPKSPLQVNFLWLLFTAPVRRIFDRDWPVAASLALRHFRVLHGLHAEERLRSISDNARDVSTEFDDLWQRAQAAPLQYSDYIFRLNISGVSLEARFTYVKLFGPGDYTLCVLSPADANSRSLLWALLYRAAHCA